MVLRVWGKKRAPVILQVLHFSFALGAFICPYLVTPFLVPIPLPTPQCNPTTQSNLSITTGSGAISSVASMITTFPRGDEAITKKSSQSWRKETSERNDAWDGGDVKREKECLNVFNISYAKTEFQTTTPSASSHNSKSIPLGHLTVPGDSSMTDNDGRPSADDRFEIGYIIIGTFIAVTSANIFIFLYTLPKFESYPHGEDEHENKDEHGPNFVTALLVYFSYSTSSATAGNLFMVGTWRRLLSESKLKFNKDMASNVAGLYWGTFALGRGLAIGGASLFSPLQMVVADIVGCLVTTVMLCFAEKHAAVL